MEKANSLPVNHQAKMACRADLLVAAGHAATKIVTMKILEIFIVLGANCKSIDAFYDIRTSNPESRGAQGRPSSKEWRKGFLVSPPRGYR